MNDLDNKNKISLNDIIQVFPGNAKLTKKYIKENPGKYPVYSSATKNKGLQGNINTYMYDGEYRTYTKDGVYAGTLFYRNEKFNLSNSFAWNVKDKKISDFKYIFYFLKSIEDKLISNINPGSTITHFYSKDLLKVKLFLPSLINQKQKSKKISELKIDLNKIKSILSKLSLFKSKLSLFKSKLSLFKSKLLNYLFYKNLKNNNEIKYSKLGNICKIITGKTPSTKNKEYWDNENGYNWLTIRDVTNNNISTERKITKKAIENFKIPITKNDNSLLFCFIASFKLFLSKKNYYFNQAIANLVPDEKILSKEYLMYYLQTQLEYLGNNHTNSLFACLSKKVISDIDIPLLSIEKQKNIFTKFLHNFYSKIETLENKFNNLINKYDKLHKKIAMLIIQKEIIY